MPKSKTFLLGDHFEEFINQQIKTGKYSSASEVVKAALRLFEFEECKKTALINELKKGENSGYQEDFNREYFLKSIHQKHVAE